MKYENLFSLRGKIAIVAGGAGAIGGELAHAVAEYGADVAIADISEQGAIAAAERLAKLGVRTMGVAVNATDPESVGKVVATIEDRLGPPNVLINTVGTHIEQPAEEVTEQAWDTVVDVNLKAAFLLSQGAARSMIAHRIGGSIIHITSVRSGLGIRRGYAAYCASKGGLAILIKQLATEWAKYNIRVNGIAPTFIRTALVQKYLDDTEFYNNLVNRIPLNRVGETSDLAGIGIFLASDASAFITGQNIFVDGGVTATQ